METASTPGPDRHELALCPQSGVPEHEEHHGHQNRGGADGVAAGVRKARDLDQARDLLWARASDFPLHQDRQQRCADRDHQQLRRGTRLPVKEQQHRANRHHQSHSNGGPHRRELESEGGQERMAHHCDVAENRNIERRRMGTGDLRREETLARLRKAPQGSGEDSGEEERHPS